MLIHNIPVRPVRILIDLFYFEIETGLYAVDKLF